MSIFCNFDVGASGRRFRRAVEEDKSDIELLVDRNLSAQVFGEVDIGSLIELSVLPICMINEYKHVVGFIALNDYPNVLGLEPGDWEMWIRNIFQKFYLARNTLFIHFMCCLDSVLDFFFEEACTSIFRNDVYLTHVVLFTACEQDFVNKCNFFKKKIIYKQTTRRTDDCDHTPHVIYIALRQDYCPKLKIRRAVEEDNDDIVEILDSKCPRLKELYGDYYISEMIGRHPESTRKIIVPEYQDHAVGMMCLNSEINYSHLQRLYELRPYHGLMKATPLEKEQMKRANALLTTFGEPIMMGQFSPFDLLNLEESLSDIDHEEREKPQEKSESVQKPSKVNFKRTRRARINMDSVTTRVTVSEDLSEEKRTVVSPTASQASNRSVDTLYLEEDPFDYEIVNIDKSLLSLAEALSCEVLLGSNKSAQSSTQSIASAQIGVLKRRILKQNFKNERRESIVPLLNGHPNAFMIELFGLRDDIDEINSFDLLEVAFEVMKDYDYCIIRVPAADTPFYLLQHFTFVPVRLRRCSKYSLYICHRSAILGRIRVRRAEVMDIPTIARFLQNMECAETITTIEHSLSGKDDYEAFVFMSGLSVVGLGILEPPEQLNYIRAKYNIDPYHNHKYHLSSPGTKAGFAAVKTILVYPVFEVHFRFFAREMMRLSGSSTLLWMTAYRDKLVAHKSNTIMSSMVPLRPRRYEMDYSKISDLMKIATMAKGILPFTTWFLDKKLTSVPVVFVSTRILVVGASRTSLAFLDSLLFGETSTYLRFNNVTVISMHGLPYSRTSSAAVETMFPKHYNTSEKYLKCSPYTSFVNTVTGTVVEIDKQNKYVTLTSGHKYFYDLLFLFIGKQYQHPEYLKPLIEQSMKCTESSPYVRLDVPNITLEPDYINYFTPENVFIINHVHEAKKALKYVRNLLVEGFDFKVAVYGATIHAYCCLSALLEMNVPPDSIVFIDPFPPENSDKARVSVFYNSNVDETVSEVLHSLGVTVYRSYFFQSWSVCGNLLTHVEFLSYSRVINVECNAFFYYGKRGLNTQVFLAINKAGMAYDAGVLIDHQCRTKDPSIYAAGPATAYYSRYFAATERHKYYDAGEVGERLGMDIRSLLDPLFKDGSQRSSSVQFCDEPRSSAQANKEESASYRIQALKEPKKPKDMLPQFVKPKVRYCKLPGGMQYLEVRSPGKKIPHHFVQSLHYKGIVMETFKSGYFKLHMTNDLIVDGITCLTYEKFALENFRTLYGRSSVVLNNVYVRYMTHKLDDFYDFFRAPWAYFLYHDQTDELFSMVKEILPKGTKNSGSTLTEALQTVIEIVDCETKKVKMLKKFEPSPYIELVTQYVIDWVSQNDILLPMYLQPSKKAEFMHDMDRDPMFKKKKKIDDPLPERVTGRDMVVVKESYRTTTGEYCVKPNPNKAMERADCGINCRRVIFMTGVEKNIQKKNITQPTLLSEMRDNYRGITKSPLAPPDITVKPPDPEYICGVVAKGRGEVPAISDSDRGFRRLLDPYVSTYRAYHKPFTAEDQYGIGAKDHITFYTEFNMPKVKGFGPKYKEIWMPLKAKVHRGVYDRIHVRKEFHEVAACRNPVSNLRGVFESETKKKFKIPFASSPLASWSNDESFELAPYPPNPYQTNIAPFMYCSDYCHIAQGTPTYTVIDQYNHPLPARKPCIKRHIVSRDGEQT